MGRLSLMAVFAHPDDEAFSIGGTLARYAAEGCDVHLVTATRGEAGQIRDPALATSANLPQVRERELRCACEAYGIHAPHFLDYVDGQLTIVNQGQAVGKLMRLIRQYRPQVLVTFGPDGIYGHYDHIAAHRWTHIAFDLAADEGCFPEQLDDTCVPHQPSKLYYLVLPQAVVSMMSQGDKPAAVMMDGVPFPMVGYEEHEITTVIDIAEYLQIKLQALQCHATQIDTDAEDAEAQQMMESPWARQEAFILARSNVGWQEGVETDLFRGLR